MSIGTPKFFLCGTRWATNGRNNTCVINCQLLRFLDLFRKINSKYSPAARVTYFSNYAKKALREIHDIPIVWSTLLKVTAYPIYLLRWILGILTFSAVQLRCTQFRCAFPKLLLLFVCNNRVYTWVSSREKLDLFNN